VRAERRAGGRTRSIAWLFLTLAFVIVLMAVPAVAVATPSPSLPPDSAPVVVHIGVFVQDFNNLDVAEGTIETSFYLTIRSEANVTISDLEIVNGELTSADTILDAPNEKEYRITAALTASPDLRRYPFDRHTIPIELEPKAKNEREMVLVIDLANSGLDPDADLPGWQLASIGSTLTNKTYVPNEVPYSRAIFQYGVERDATSTVLKFFLPIALIIVVALSSLMIKISSRLGLNASMFLAAVLIHWRVADAIPLVAYATFLDLFMIITYATLVMVLVSGLLILKFTEAKDPGRVEQVNHWSIRIIPTLSISLYGLLFLSLAF
jgi:hypothetical protein